MIFKNKKVVVLGLGRSGIAAAVALKRSGARVFASDSLSVDINNINILRNHDIEYEINGHTEKIYDCDIAVISPGIPLNNDIIKEIRKRQILLISEIEVAYNLTNADFIAITGSNGKTTATTLLGEIFKKGFNNKSFVGGNIGNAACEGVLGLKQQDVVIVEVSSFQLDTIRHFKPKISIILNLTPDHLDRYKNETEYYLSKISISKNQKDMDCLILNGDDSNILTNKDFFNKRVKKHFFNLSRKDYANQTYIKNNRLLIEHNDKQESLFDISAIKIKGKHNLYNIMAVVTAAYLYGIGKDTIKHAVSNFKGVEHRLEFVREKDGIIFYNDSKATNIDSMAAAIKSMENKIQLIAGGRDKNMDFSLIKDTVKGNVKNIYAIGEASEKINKTFNDIVPVFIEKNMKRAVCKAFNDANTGDVVLLSPGCSSFDNYKNYMERGNDFKQEVKKL